MAMSGEALQDDMFDKLRHLKGFAEYEAKVKAEAEAEAATVKAEAEARVAAAEAEVAVERARMADVLADFLIHRGDKPTDYAVNTIAACRNTATLAAWLRRAYYGETSAELFPEPQSPAN